MKRVGLLFAALCVTLLFAGAAAAEMYKWEDERGVIHFSDFPPATTVAPGGVEVITTYESSISEVPGESSGEEFDLESAHEPPPVEEPDRRAKVELYSTSWCRYCAKARAFFRSRGVKFTEYDIEKDKNAARRKRRLSARKGVPFAVINGRKIHGFSEAAYTRALEGSG